MKQFFIFAFLFLIMGGIFYINAQDLIILKNGNVIEAKVLEISSTEIRYKRFDHLEGPTIVIMAVDVLSIRYENGRTEVINAVLQPATTTSSAIIPSTAVLEDNQPNLNPRLNTIGATVGYQGISAYGFTVNGTVSPGNYTFFDFTLGLGFNSFAINGRINFNAFVPFKNGGWYAGAGIGGGYNELLGGVFVGNITTGFIFFNWLNVAYTLQIGTFDEILNHNIAVGYSYRFKSQQTSVSDNITQNANTQNNENRNRNIIEIVENYTITRVTGQVEYQEHFGASWVDVNVGDVLTKNNIINIPNNSSIIITDGNRSIRIASARAISGRLEYLIQHHSF